MIRQNLLRKYDRALGALQKSQMRLNDAKSDLSVDCKHDRVSAYPWTHSDGVGTHTSRQGYRCTFCNAVSFYRDGRWTRQEDISGWDD